MNLSAVGATQRSLPSFHIVTERFFFFSVTVLTTLRPTNWTGITHQAELDTGLGSGSTVADTKAAQRTGLLELILG
jgi:hypothetical protein